MLLQTGIVLGETIEGNLLVTDLLNGAFKFIFVLAFLLYTIFAFVAIRQISVMRKTLLTPFSPIIQIVGYIHFALAAAVLLLFILL